MPVEFVSSVQPQQLHAVRNDEIEKPKSEFLTLKTLQKTDFYASGFQRVEASEAEMMDGLQEEYRNVLNFEKTGAGGKLTATLKRENSADEAHQMLKKHFDAPEQQNQDKGWLSTKFGVFKEKLSSLYESAQQWFGAEARPLGMDRTKHEAAEGGKVRYGFKLTTGGNRPPGGEILVDRRSYSGVKNFFAKLGRVLLSPFILVQYAVTGKSLWWQYTARGQIHAKTREDAKLLGDAVSKQVEEIVVRKKNGAEEKNDAAQKGDLDDFLKIAIQKKPEELKAWIRDELKKPEGSFLNKSTAKSVDDTRFFLNPARWFGSKYTAEGQDANKTVDLVTEQIYNGIIEGTVKGHIHLVGAVIADVKSSAAEGQAGELIALKEPLSTFIRQSNNLKDIPASIEKLQTFREDIQKAKDGVNGKAEVLGAQNTGVVDQMLTEMLADLDACIGSLEIAKNLMNPETDSSLGSVNQDIAQLLADAPGLNSEQIDERSLNISEKLAQANNLVDGSKANLLESHYNALKALAGDGEGGLAAALGAATKIAKAESEVLSSLKNGPHQKSTIDEAMARLNGLADDRKVDLNPVGNKQIEKSTTETSMRLDTHLAAFENAVKSYDRAGSLGESGAQVCAGIREGKIQFSDVVGGRNDAWNNMEALVADDVKNLAVLKESYGFVPNDFNPANSLESRKAEVVASTIGMDATEGNRPALASMFASNAAEVLPDLKTAQQGGKDVSGTLIALHKIATSEPKGLESTGKMFAASKALGMDSTATIGLSKLFAPQDQMEFIDKLATLESVNSHVARAADNKELQAVFSALKIEGVGSSLGILTGFTKLPNIGKVTPNAVKDVSAFLEKVGDPGKPNFQALNDLPLETLKSLEAVGQTLADGIYSAKEFADIQAKIKAENLIATLSNAVVDGSSKGLTDARVGEALAKGARPRAERQSEFDSVTAELQGAVESFVQCSTDIRTYTAERELAANSLSSILSKGNAQGGKSPESKEILEKVQQESTQKAFQDIVKLSEAKGHFESLEDQQLGVDQEYHYKELFEGALADQAAQPFIKKYGSEFTIQVAQKLQDPKSASGTALKKHLETKADAAKAFETLRSTLPGELQKTYTASDVQRLFSKPAGEVAKKRDVLEAQKRLITEKELGDSYLQVSERLKDYSKNRIQAFEDTKQFAQIEQLEAEFSSERIKELYQKDPSAVGKMLRLAENAKDMSVAAWKNSYYAAMLSDSSARLKRFNLETLEYDKQGKWSKFKEAIGLGSGKPTISGSVQKYLNQYPEADKTIANLLALESQVKELQGMFPDIKAAYEKVVADRDSVLSNAGKLAAKTAFAIALGEIWSAQGVEGKSVAFKDADVLSKLAPLGITEMTYPDLKIWLDEAKNQGVDQWIESHATGMKQVESDLALKKKSVEEEMEKLASFIQDEIGKVGQKIDVLNAGATRFTKATCRSLAGTELLEPDEVWMKNLKHKSPEQIDLGDLLAGMDPIFQSEDNQNRIKKGGRTKTLFLALTGLKTAYKAAEALDRQLSDGEYGGVLADIEEQRKVVNEAVDSIRKLGKFDKVTTTSNREKLRLALTNRSQQAARSPVEEMAVLINERFDRLESYWKAARANIQKEGAFIGGDDSRLGANQYNEEYPEVEVQEF